jgi:hypothetical protein
MSNQTPRDPRIDPIPGDCVERTLKSGIAHRIVTSREGWNVFYNLVTATSKRPRPCMCWITTWREWCKDGTIINPSTNQPSNQPSK